MMALLLMEAVGRSRVEQFDQPPEVIIMSYRKGSFGLWDPEVFEAKPITINGKDYAFSPIRNMRAWKLSCGNLLPAARLF